MELTKEFAEILDMFAADGCLQDNYICMWGNITEDRDYYDKVVCPLFSKVFKKKVVAHEKKSNSVYGFYLCGKDVVELFRSLGFSNNKTYNVRVPKKVFESDDPEIISAFVRGYADCDGNINFLKRKGKYREFKLKYNTYPRIEVNSVSHQVIKEISVLLRRLNVNHRVNIRNTKKKNEKQSLAIRIRGPERVGYFLERIGFGNPSHVSKYMIWKRFGMCPVRTIHVQRKLILKGKLDPFSFYENGSDRI